MLSWITLQTALTFVQGFMLSASLIIAVGPQNLFLLRQGLRRRYLFATVIACTLVDLCLITLGVGGLGSAIAANQQVLMVTTAGGVTFLLGYGVRSFHYGCWGCPATSPLTAQASLVGLKGTLVAALSFSLLNPTAYIDTLLILGTTSGRYPIDERMIFGVGAVMASSLWFFTLTYGASHLTPLFRHPAAWRLSDVVSGCIMLGLAGSLFATQAGLFW